MIKCLLVPVDDKLLNKKFISLYLLGEIYETTKTFHNFRKQFFKVDKTKELNAVMSTMCTHNTNYFPLKFPPSSLCFCDFIVVLDVMIAAAAK